MAWLRRALGGLGALFRRRHLEDELDEELRACLEMSIDEKMRAGMPRDAAVRAARVEMGSLAAVKDHTRDAGWEAGVESVWQDVRCALRMLSKSPGFSLLAVLTLALGIGANTAIFSLVNGLLLRTLPVPAPGRLVTISSDYAVRFGFTAGAGWNHAMWDRLRQREGAFGGALAFTAETLNLAPAGERQPADGLFVSGEFFTTVGVPALLGRTFTPADDVRGGGPDGPVAVISHRLWQRHFGGAAGIIGTPIVLDGVPFTIVGVTPPEFLHVEVGRTFDVAVPLATQPLISGTRAAIDQPRALILIVMLRLKPEQSLDAATATLRAMQPDILGVTPDQLPRVRPALLAEPFTLVPASAGTSGAAGAGLRQQYETPLLAILIIVALVLLIACANLANLLLARATARRHEVSVRRALGASRWRIARQWLVESAVLAVLGAGAGLAVAAWGSRAIVAQLSTAQSAVTLDLSLDWAVLAYTLALTAATVMFFGTVPALRATRSAPIDALKAPGSGSGRQGGLLPGGRSAGGGSNGLVIVQVAFSLVLLAAAGLCIRTFDKLAHVPLGFDPERVLVINVDDPHAPEDPAARYHAYERLADAITRVPGVTGVAASIWTPLGGGGLVSDAQGRAIDSARTVTNAIAPRWLDVYNIGLLAGRDFDSRDAANTPPVAIVNEAFVRRLLPGRQAIGETVQGVDNTRRTVVGVAADAIFGSSLRDAVPPTMYIPLAQSAGWDRPSGTGIRISVHAASESGAMTRRIATALTAVNRDVTFSFRPLADSVDAALARERLVARLSGFFGALAVLLAAVGLYGLTACTAAHRRREIAIRMALGARRTEVITLVLRRSVGLTATGVFLGLAATAGITRYVEGLLYGVTPLDPATLIGVSLLFLAVAATASSMPARRASRLDPMVVLRAE
jgi:predicted permease